MNSFRNREYRVPNGYLCILWLLSIFSTGCQNVDHESSYIQSQTAAERAKISMSPGELRMRLNALAGVFSGTIEQAADRVIAETGDPVVERRARMWKINAIPAAYRALFQGDPAVALIDTWAFCIQMTAYFEGGAGKDSLRQWHPLALDACRTLETRVVELVQQTRIDGNIEPFEQPMQAWAAEHPIQHDFVYRDTAVALLRSKSGQRKLNAVQTVGSMALGVEDIAFRLFLYMDLVTKQARWQAECFAADTDQDAGIRAALRSLDDIDTAVHSITQVVEGAPNLIADEKEAVLTALNQERVAALADIDRQRIDTLAYVTGERRAVIDELKTVQQDITRVLQTEREIVLESIESQRKALLMDVEHAGSHIVEHAPYSKAIRLWNHFFIRVSQLLTVVLLLGGVIATLIRHRLQRKRIHLKKLPG